MRFLPFAILFAIAVAAFTLITKYGYQNSLEAELSQQAEAALNEAGPTGVAVDFEYHNAILSGEVESREQQEEALRIVAETLPMTVVPTLEESTIGIKPTLPPLVRVERSAGSSTVSLSGTFSASGASNRKLLASRLSALEGIESVKNTLSLDPGQLPFPNAAALASLSESLLNFGSNSEIVNSKGKEKIEKIATLIKEAGVPVTLKVTGFADNLGTAEHNRELSLRRANSVVALMVSNGITKDTMSTDSVGEDVTNVSRSERWKGTTC